MISARFGFAVGLLLGVALIPTILHNYLGLVRDDGRVSAGVSTSLAGLIAESTSRPAGWVEQTFRTHDWVERRYKGTDDIVLFVARSYDPKRLYHRPERQILGIEFEQLGIIRLPDRQDVPMHLFTAQGQKRPGLVAYSLLYGEELVENPYLSQLRAAGQLLFKGRQPMTLFLVYDAAFSETRSLERTVALPMLVEAIDSFLMQPRRTR
jgi:hypothetical protein